MATNFGLLLAYARKKAGYTQEQAAELIDMDVRTLARYECNEALPKIETMDKLCEIYQDEFIGYEYLLNYKLGKRLFSHLRECSLAESTLSFAVNLQEAKNYLSDLMVICRDGQIDQKEKPKYTKIINALRLVAKDILLLRFLGNKKACISLQARKIKMF